MPLGYSITALAVAVLVLAYLESFTAMVPRVVDSLLRDRGSNEIEGSIKKSRDRNLLCLTMVLALVLLSYRYSLVSPAFIAEYEPEIQFLMTAGLVLGYALLHIVLYVLLKPRRGSEYYRRSNNTGYNFFIVAALLMSVTAAVMSLTPSSDLAVRRTLYIEMLVFYILMIGRRAQILRLNCRLLPTFLYLCALEFLPLALLICTAVLL